MPTISPLDPNHIPPPPGRARPGPVAGGLRITVIGLGPLQEACLAGMLALALSWVSAELLFRVEAGTEAAPRAILSAALQP
jgi:hypothetical protein